MKVFICEKMRIDYLIKFSIKPILFLWLDAQQILSKFFRKHALHIFKGDLKNFNWSFCHYRVWQTFLTDKNFFSNPSIRSEIAQVKENCLFIVQEFEYLEWSTARLWPLIKRLSMIYSLSHWIILKINLAKSFDEDICHLIDLIFFN